MTDPVPSKKQCKCTLRQSILGDGCEVCNPKQALEYAKEQIADLECDNARWENARNVWMAEEKRLKALVARLKEYICVTALAGYRCASCAERLTARSVHEREPPHCSTCGCGLAPEPAVEPAHVDFFTCCNRFIEHAPTCRHARATQPPAVAHSVWCNAPFVPGAACTCKKVDGQSPGVCTDCLAAPGTDGVVQHREGCSATYVNAEIVR